MALPGVACAVLFAFTLCWNAFLYSLVFIQDELYKTLSVGVLTELVRGDISFWGSLMAACLTGSIPIIVVYALCMDYYVSGLTAGAVK
jgi:multiple sugar transport system permease protein